MSTPPPVLSRDGLRAAFRVSATSVAWTVAASAAAIVAGIMAHALVLVVFGLTGVLDAAGSWALALHFKHALKHEAISPSRERLALRIVSIGLVSIGLFAIEESTRRLIARSGARSSLVGVVITAVSIVALTVLTVWKRAIARRVKSGALWADSWLSATGAALAVIAVAGIASSSDHGLYWVDPATALLVALLAATTGVGFLRQEEHSLMPKPRRIRSGREARRSP